jgi:glutamine amidotransferase
MSSIAVIDYDMGNVKSVLNALREVGGAGELVRDPAAVRRYDKLVLPGVGAFGAAMENLARSGMKEALDEAWRRETPIFGICLGMQLLAKRSEEGGVKGFGWIDAEVVRFSPGLGVKIPHMGWNELTLTRENPLVKGVAPGADVYFVHSYYMKNADERDVLATTDHGVRFTAMVARDHVMGAQFHPEKSQMPGLAMLRNFVSMEASAGGETR